MFENWIVNDGDENRENLEQSRYYDLITRDGKFTIQFSNITSPPTT